MEPAFDLNRRPFPGYAAARCNTMRSDRKSPYATAELSSRCGWPRYLGTTTCVASHRNTSWHDLDFLPANCTVLAKAPLVSARNVDAEGWKMALESLAKGISAAHQTRFHSAQRYVHDFGDLLVRQFLNIAEYDRGSIWFGDRLQFGFDASL